jgi:hypothetical protein
VTFKEKAWLESALSALSHLGLTYTYNEGDRLYEVHYKPIEKYRGQNLRFVEGTVSYQVVADSYLVDRELREVMGLIEGKYTDEMIKGYAETQGFMIEDEIIRDSERSLVMVRY